MAIINKNQLLGAIKKTPIIDSDTNQLNPLWERYFFEINNVTDASAIQSLVGDMVTDNIETGITVTFSAIDGNLDFVVSDTTVTCDTGSTGITPGDTLTIVGGDLISTDIVGDTITVSIADGTDGELITWNATGAPTTISAGTSGQVLTSNGAGAAPTFQSTEHGLHLISSQNASSSSNISFTGLSSTYFCYIVELVNIVPGTDSANLVLRTSTDGGASYDSATNNYSTSAFYVLLNGTGSSQLASGTTAIDVGRDIGNATGEALSGTVKIYGHSEAQYCRVIVDTNLTISDGSMLRTFGGGTRLALSDIDAIQFSMSSGNIASGTFKLYGVQA